MGGDGTGGGAQERTCEEVAERLPDAVARGAELLVTRREDGQRQPVHRNVLRRRQKEPQESGHVKSREVRSGRDSHVLPPVQSSQVK
jgi:hypothetical protein